MGENGKDMIGDYELLSLIGDGAQGRVYKARCVSEMLPHVKAGEEVALKVVRITGEDEKLRLKFQEQADILRRLSHTNIVSYRDCFAWHAGEWDEAQCLVMELLEGEPLSDRLKKANSGLPWTQVEEIFEQCLAGLIHARERGITHRDIKPSNIFITKDGQAKLIDFDIARRDDSGQMSTAGWKGTFDYMAPDFISINGFRGDEVSDIFSLGVCFYQALTGSLPYEPLGDTAHIGYLNRWRNNAAPVPSYRPGVFRVLSNAKAFVAKCLSVKREERYSSFMAMLEDFRKIRYRRIRHKNKEEYELLSVLGRGGFGEVFKARRVSDGMLVAVKYLFSEKQSERFLKEAKILQQYPHPNLVKYVDFMMFEGTAGEKQFFLVMEFLEGMPGWTLRHRIKNEKKLEVGEAIPLFCGYLSALQFLHGSAKPIIHRDIKPGNLYAPMSQPEKGKIFDLGVARDVSGTVTVGGVPGTLDYMAPEFAEAGGDRGSPQSDLYALGLCLYEALAGKPVFERLPTDLNSAWLAFQDRIRKPPPIDFDAEAFVQYPRLKLALAKTLAENPASRFRSAADMRVALEDALKPESAHLAHDDGFDAGEVTMATFSGASQPSADAGVTLGTRPLEAVGGTLSGAMEQLAAGRNEAAGRKRRTLLLAAGGVAAAVLVTGLATLFLRGRRDGNTPDVTPGQRESGAAEVRNADEERLAKQKAEADVEKARLEAERLEAERVAAEKAAAEKAAADKLAAEKEAVEKARLEAERLEAERVAAEKAAAEKAAADKLAAEKAAADAKAAEEARLAKERKARIDAALQTLNGLEGRLAKGALSECGDIAKTLGAFSPETLGDETVKAKWEAAKTGYTKLVAQTLLQKDPLAQRAQRIKAVEEALGQTESAALFGEEAAATLRRALDQQKEYGLLRLVNQSASSVDISAKELPEKTTLSAGETKEWQIPVSDKTLGISIKVDGGGQSSAQALTVYLPRAGGVEQTVRVLEPVAAKKPAEPQRQAPPPAVAETPPKPDVKAPQAGAQATAAAAGSQAAVIEITLSPKTAQVTVDDQPAQAGRMEVTPNENHKVTVACPGYKPVQQYYKVRPGETRKIDILLEKEVKKSFFGF